MFFSHGKDIFLVDWYENYLGIPLRFPRWPVLTEIIVYKKGGVMQTDEKHYCIEVINYSNFSVF